MRYEIIFTAESEFSVEVEAESKEEAIQEFNESTGNGDGGVDWSTLVNSGYNVGDDTEIIECND